jgi:cytochrome P450
VAPPADPVAAVTHSDPYPYYATLLARGPHRHDGLDMWIVARAADVTAALTSERCRVRPPGEPVPAALAGTAAGDVFGQLVRMNDGAGHDGMKRAVTASLGALDMTRVSDATGRAAQRLVETLEPAVRPERVSDFAFRLPAAVVASVLGFPDDALPAVVELAGEFVQGIAPGSAPTQVERGAAAAAGLRQMMRDRLRSRDDSLLGALARSAHAEREREEAVVANAIGFLSQAYDATAGLVGNTLVALARERTLRDRVRADPGQLRSVVREVARHDPPVQNTRRFVAHEGDVAGRAMRTGDTVLVVLAAANHDPAVNPHPARFDVARPNRQTFTFGVGPHACPGEAVATTIAQIGVERLLAAGVDPEALVASMTYRPSANARIPVFRPRA